MLTCCSATVQFSDSAAASHAEEGPASWEWARARGDQLDRQPDSGGGPYSGYSGGGGEASCEEAEETRRQCQCQRCSKLGKQTTQGCQGVPSRA